MNTTDWLVNIENLSEVIAEEYGYEVICRVLKRYGVRSISDLSPVFYAEVFSDLELLYND